MEKERKGLFERIQTLEITKKEIVNSYEERIIKERKEIEVKCTTQVSKL